MLWAPRGGRGSVRLRRQRALRICRSFCSAYPLRAVFVARELLTKIVYRTPQIVGL